MSRWRHCTECDADSAPIGREWTDASGECRTACTECEASEAAAAQDEPKEPTCEACNDTGEVGGDPCVECCEHEFDPDEGFTCLNCGKQGEPSDCGDEDYGQER